MNNEKCPDTVDQSAINSAQQLDMTLLVQAQARAQEAERPASLVTRCVECDCCIVERKKLIHWADKCAKCTTELLALNKRNK